MNVTLIGYFGYGNLGDELLLDRGIEELLAVDGEIKLTALSRRPHLTRRAHRIRATQRYNPISVLWAFLRSRVTLALGGLLQDETSLRSLLYYTLILWTANMLGNRLGLLGAGIGPLERRSSRWLLRRVIHRFDFITVRDEESLRILKGMDPRCQVHRTCDLLFEHFTHPYETIPPSDSGKRPTIGMALKPCLSISKAAGLADDIIGELKGDVVMIPFHRGEDLPFTKLVMASMRHKASIVCPEENIEMVLRSYRSLDMLLGMRYHALLLALAMGIPVFGITQERKIFDLLSECGGSLLQPEGMSSGEALEIIRGILSRREGDNIPKGRMFQMARGNRKLLEDFIRRVKAHKDS